MIVDRDALFSETFVEVARLPIATMADRDDFCVFPWLRDVSIDEVEELASQGNPLAVSLVDNIHLDPSMESLANLMETIRRYLDNIETLRASTVFERLALGATQVLGKVAGGLSCAVVLTALVLSVMVFRRILTGILSTHGVLRDALAILVWAAVSILVLRFQRLFCLLRSSPDLQRDYPGFAMEFFAVGGAGLVVSLTGASLDMGRGVETLAVGLGLGIMLVSLVRKGRRASIRALSFAELPMAIAQGTILPRLCDRMAQSVVNTGIPLFEPVHKRVFISYSHSSAWSSKVAYQIAASLRDLGAYVFFDQLSLRPGLSWKRQLRWAIASSNVFVVVLDKAACRREWIAAEFATAYQNKMAKGTPEIFIVHPEEIDFAESDSPIGSFFAELIVRPSRAIPERMRSRMAPYDAENCTRMCRAIWSYPIAGAFGVLANLAVALITGPLVPVVGLACYLGLPLLLVHVLVMEGIISPDSLLGTCPVMAMPVAVALALTGGFSMRCSLRSFAEIRRSDYSYTPGYIELFEATAFFAGLAYCFPWLSLVGVCLVVLMVFLGLELGSVFTLCMRTWKRQSM